MRRGQRDLIINIGGKADVLVCPVTRHRHRRDDKGGIINRNPPPFHRRNQPKTAIRLAA